MKILCLDGGGVFGDLQADVLSGVDALDKFDCFVGTSHPSLWIFRPSSSIWQSHVRSSSTST